MDDNLAVVFKPSVVLPQERHVLPGNPLRLTLLPVKHPLDRQILPETHLGQTLLPAKQLMTVLHSSTTNFACKTPRQTNYYIVTIQGQT